MNFIPQVDKIEVGNGKFNLRTIQGIYCNNAQAVVVANLLKGYFENILNLVITSDDKYSDDVNYINLIDLNDYTLDEQFLVKEGYTLEVNDKGISITAPNRYALAQGVQTLRQMLIADVFANNVNSELELLLDYVKITDKPKFRWRGLHFDASRHFSPKEEVFRFIELMAQHKFNVFHWHLTDDQGWRVEIEAFPKLTTIASQRAKTVIGNGTPQKFDNKEHGGFYTKDDIREVIAFADARGITIVPEIDMPGHMQAAVTAYPEWSNNPSLNYQVRTTWGVSQNILSPRKSTIDAMKTILGEIIELFPSKYIHIGGDEAAKYEWENSEEVQNIMCDLNLKNVHEMQSYFISQLNDFLKANERILIGWDEILEGGLCNDAVVTCWRNEDYAISAVKHGNYVINCMYTYAYFDYYQADPSKEPLAIGGDLPIEKVYRFTVTPKDLDNDLHKYILGGQGQVWREYMPTFKQVEYMIYPRACALGEVLWSGNQYRFSDFVKRLNVHRGRLAAQNVNCHDLP